MRSPSMSVPLISDDPIPRLVFSHITDNVQTFSTAPFNDKSHVRNIPALQDKTILASQFGWLILLDDNFDDPDCYRFTLYDPITSISITLPPLMYHHDAGQRHEKCLLTSPPLDGNCFLFFCLSDQAFVCRCQPRNCETGSSSSCRWYDRRIEIEGESVYLGSIVALNGVIYGLASYLNQREDFFISINIATDDNASNNPFITLTPIPLALPARRFSDLLRVQGDYMVESCGSIYLVKIGTRNYDGAHAVKVWELEWEQGTSVEVKCLGDRAFFLCYDDCTWGWASTTIDNRSESDRGVEGNCLYIFDDDIAKGGVVMYSLKDCCSTLLPCGIRLNDNWSTKRVNWVMPQHHWFVAGQEAKKLTGNRDNDVSKSCRTVDATECKQLLKQNEPQGERLSELPHDLIELLSRYMHLFDYWNFRCTSKIIQSATPLPLWRTNNVFPLFLVFEDTGELCRLMDPCRDDSHPCVLRFSQDYFDILFSKDGWLLISDCKTLEFFNPFTKERRDLPPNSSSDPIGFSTNPTCSKCLTVGFSYKLNEIIIQYFRFGDTKWNSCHFDNSQEPQFCIGYSCSPVYYAGAFYWLDESGYLGVFELVDEETSWRVYDSPFTRAHEFHSCYLVQCGPELLSVFIRPNGKSVVVFSFKQSKKRWVHKQSLGNYALFLKSNSSTSVATNDTKMKNTIYLPLIQGHHIVYYCYETKRYYVNGNEVSSNNFFKKNPSRCCWI